MTIPQQIDQVLANQKTILANQATLDTKVNAVATTVAAIANVLGTQDLGPAAQALADKLKQSSDALKAAVAANQPV
jgi:hypothetical protein